MTSAGGNVEGRAQRTPLAGTYNVTAAAPRGVRHESPPGPSRGVHPEDLKTGRMVHPMGQGGPDAGPHGILGVSATASVDEVTCGPTDGGERTALPRAVGPVQSVEGLHRKAEERGRPSAWPLGWDTGLSGLGWAGNTSSS